MAAGEEGDKIRLRLHYNGQIQTVDGVHRWSGGEVYNESIPMGYKYADWCQRLNDKFGDTVSFRYLAPGDGDDLSNLVTVLSDDDLNELYDEYRTGLHNAMKDGTPQRTFRIKVFVFPALQYEWCMHPEEPGAEDEMDASLCEDPEEEEEEAIDALDTEPINFDSWGSGGNGISDRSARSGGPSSDTEMQWHGVTATAAGAGAGEAARGPAVRAQRGNHSGAQPSTPGALPGMMQPAVLAATLTAAGGPTLAAPSAEAEVAAGADQLLEHGLHNIAVSVHRHFSSVGNFHGLVQEDGFTADDFALDDPYHEQDCELQERLRQQQLRQQQQQVLPLGRISRFQSPQRREGQASHLPQCQGEPLANKPLDRVREAALAMPAATGGVGGLPSHISEFGDAASDGGLSRRASIRVAEFRLPSHISAFGDGEGLDLPPGSELVTQDMETDAAARLHGNDMWHLDDAALGHVKRRNDSKCITQDFTNDGSLVRPEGDLAVLTALEFNFQLPGADGAVIPTPKLLEAVVKVPREEVRIARKIGEGAFGEVSQATVFPYGTVAIKWLKKDRFAKYSESFTREAEVLATLNHPNIIRMYGLVTERDSMPSSTAAGASSSSDAFPSERNGGATAGTSSVPAPPPAPTGMHAGDGLIIAGIMTEYVRGGPLSHQLRSLARRLTLRERCQIALQAALGMSYLHDQNPAVIHFDLKPDNLLVEGEIGGTMRSGTSSGGMSGSSSSETGAVVPLIKVADFGLSKHKFTSYVSCRDLRGTLPYMAPELVSNPNQVCEKCDVWSMGVVMWELYTLESPFQELNAQQILMGLMHGSLHLHVPSECEPEWRGMVETCMDPKPEARPTFKELATQLEAILRQLQ